MNVKDILKTSFFNVFSNKVRTFLTMLGIIVGISSVIMIMAVGQGSTDSMKKQFASMGAGNLTITANTRGNTLTNDQLLSDEEYQAISKISYVEYPSPVQSFSTYIKLQDQTKLNNADISGVNQNYVKFENPTFDFGRYISQTDVDNAANVCVITNTTALKVFGVSTADVLGKQISLNTWKGTYKFTVVGITHNDNTDAEMLAPDQFTESITVPYTALENLTYSKIFSKITAVIKDPNATDDYSTPITDVLDGMHNTSGNYRVQNLLSLVSKINSTLNTMVLFISVVAGISLLVGGIGVMNIMLVTVTERTREIGIRKSIGAKKRDILLQFLIEALILTGTGGVIGIILGYAGSKVLGNAIGTGSVLSPVVVAFAFLVSTLIGVVFGVYPADKASKLNPIDALRFE